MSGDVQPRKRKDKKRKKDELGLEEPRGTAAVFGEGDVFMHSQHDHGTGGHWCAKIIFFSLLAILVTLIGLIILENRGLSELEANAVESRYSGVLEGWLEDAPDDDHHDEHTLELNHHDDDDEGHDQHASNVDHNEGEELELSEEHEHNDEDDHQLIDDEDESNEDEGDENQSNENEVDEDNNDDDEEDNEEDQENINDSREQDLENDEDEDVESNQNTKEDDDDTGYQMDEAYDNEYDNDNENDDDLQDVGQNDNDDSNNSVENDDDENNNNESGENAEENENQDNEDDEEHEEEEEDEVEVEKLEQEASEEDLEPVSTELPALPEEDEDDNNDEALSEEKEPEDEEDSGIEDEGEEFLEMDDADEPPVEKITVPAGKPFVEVEEEVSSEQPPDTLEEEEEYEKLQEELRKEEAQASHMWLKLGVGAALLVATHAVMRRATHSRDAPEADEHGSREETPIVDRRLTLIPEETHVPARKAEDLFRPVVEKQVEKVIPILKSVTIQKQESEEEEEPAPISEDEEEEVVIAKPTVDKELHSDEEPEEEIEEEEEEEEIVPVKKETLKLAPVFTKQPEPEEVEDDEDPEDVEIIGDEQLEEELEEEVDEEEISDVDDAELLSRLEAKYGKLPEPERPGPKQKDGGNNIEDVWPGEPSDAYWRQQLDSAEQELRQAAAARAGSARLRGSARALLLRARALDAAADARRDNRLLGQAIAAYLDLLKVNDRLSDKQLLPVAARALDRIQFRGNYLNAEPVYRLLIRRFPNEPAHRNNLTIAYLMANRVDLAEETLKETLQRWPNDRVALAHHAFVLKTNHKKYEEAAETFKKALEGDAGPANEPRFYYHYGDSLLLLGRQNEARAVHTRGAELGHFLSPSQRSLYNVNRLKSEPWWDIAQTPYLRLAKALEKSWKEILKEGEAAKALYEKEKEGLKERGEWSQLDLFVRGQEIPDRCKRAPVTCSIVKSEPAAAGCRRGQVKFSSMAAGTHVRAHVGPTNCRLRMHLGLSNTKDTYIRVDKEIRQWEVGKVLMFDDSFEHEVWHNGTGPRLVLIVDVWHPHLTAHERRQLPAI